MQDQTGTPFTAIHAIPITNKGLSPELEGAQADADLAAGADHARTSGIRLADQFDRLLAVRGAGQPSASSRAA